MLLRSMRIGLVLAIAGLAVSQANAFDAGMGAGCGGGIGSSSGCSGYTSGSFGCTGYGGGYTGWTYGGGASGFGSTSPGGRGYKGWGLAGTREKSSTVARSAASQSTSAARSSTPRSTSATAHGVLLKVSVPADAKLFINDLPTTSTGEIRQFSSKRFPPGTVYRYRVRAEFVNNEVPVVEERVVRLSDGKEASLEFVRGATAPLSEVAATDRRPTSMAGE